jgi:hypothetical protein
LLLVQSKALDEAPYKFSGAAAKLAGITFWSLAFFYWFDKPRFLTERKLAAVLIIPSLGVPNWSVIYINTAPQSISIAHNLVHYKFKVFIFVFKHHIKANMMKKSKIINIGRKCVKSSIYPHVVATCAPWGHYKVVHDIMPFF